MANQVTLTFAGETRQLETSMDRVGGGAEVMAVRVTQATNQSAERFDHLSTQSSLLSGGIGDIGGALNTAFGDDTAIGAFGAKMEEASAVVTGFTGLMDLGVFATNNFKIATAASAVQQRITAGATRAWAAAQRVLNIAFLTSPLTWVVIAIVAIVAVVVLIARRTDWFSKGWRAAWRWVKDAAGNTWEYLKKIPGWIGTAFGRVANFITAPFRYAFNAVARAWNGTVGQLSWSVPGWVPGIGGNSISVPRLPTFHAGGVVPGVVGTPTMAMLLAGEKVSNPAAGGGSEITIGSDGSRMGDLLVDLIATSMRRSRGGDPAALGIRRGALA